jgi:hypothetical protein
MAADESLREPHPSSGLSARVDELIALFNRRALDLPEGLFDRRTQFVLNDAPFETLLGQSPSDPLILMLSRGPAGYRFSVKALQHAMPDVRIQRGEISGDGARASCRLWLSGTLRETGRPLETVVGITMTIAAGGHMESVAATLDDGDLALIREARLRT